MPGGLCFVDSKFPAPRFTGSLDTRVLFVLKYLQAFEQDPKLLALLGALLKHKSAAAWAAVPAQALSAEQIKQLQGLAVDAGIATAGGWDLGNEQVSLALTWRGCHLQGFFSVCIVRHRTHSLCNCSSICSTQEKLTRGLGMTCSMLSCALGAAVP